MLDVDTVRTFLLSAKLFYNRNLRSPVENGHYDVVSVVGCF
jgi:hypothetical protein